MENGPFEDVFPIKNGDIPLLFWFTRGYVIVFLYFSCIYHIACDSMIEDCYIWGDFFRVVQYLSFVVF